jgi:hypothetical protein
MTSRRKEVTDLEASIGHTFMGCLFSLLASITDRRTGNP